GAAAAAVPASAAPAPERPLAAGGFAPYTDMSNSQESVLDTAITGHGVKTFTAGFVIGSGCNQIWGDTLPVGDDSFTDPLISKAKSEGASVIVSSGGAAGLPLAWSCTDQSAITTGYQKIIDSYSPSSLDFDIEGAAIADTAAATRNMTAMKALKAANPGFTFSVTLPVLPDGLTADGVNIVKAAKDVGVKIDVVNIMTMDYYQGTQDMGQAAINAAKSTLAQIQGVDPGYTYADLGITPMIGVNDDGSVFSTDNASAVKSWASQNGVGRLSFWSVNRDQSCGSTVAAASPTCSGVSQGKLAFTDIFNG
ncbi:lysozyme, partial [Streptomyces sp. 150FB]|uniref:chitinase n=1 Tax=Streptomyces sp. 150FB TaxID=1576605 RepID=UPI0005891390